jgi:hypothetical protein
MFLNTQADQLYEIHSKVKKKITRIMTKRNRFMEEFEKRKFIDFHLKYSTLTRNLKPTTSKESSFFPDSADHKVILTLSPTYLRCEVIFNLDDYGKKGSIAGR